jgi:hypothetical protein
MLCIVAPIGALRIVRDAGGVAGRRRRAGARAMAGGRALKEPT